VLRLFGNPIAAKSALSRAACPSCPGRAL